ncbi:NfeD family protein [Desulfovermiculus halophilus]|uniref:NfeD family protein n=1 Tax=Desulfovermiculus halophilus TaxID=339722 RepID=UPI000ADACAC2|nr:nodulation protein NfeD [Desulfovermiculus halophilus]
MSRIPRSSSCVFFALAAVLLCLLTAMTSGPFLPSPASAADAPQVSVLYARLDGTINPAKKDLLDRAIQTCTEDGHDLLLVGLDTPGGLGQSMREMVKTILNSPVPVAVWVGPKGARAASAGVFLVAASHVAGMSPQTSIGAASPVAMGGKELPETVAKKITNDFVSLIRGAAGAQDRNVDWYEKSVLESVSITANEAVMQQVVEFLALTPRDMLEQIGTRGISIQGRTVSFGPQDAQLTKFEPGFRTTFLSWLLHPQIAYFLLLGGIAGLFFELSNPGSIFPGVFGAVCLLLGLYALAVLPTNAAGILLIFLAMILFILELAVTSYGLLSVGAVVCLFIGSLILFNFEYGFEGLTLQVILPTVLAVSAFILLGLYLVTRAQVRPRQTGSQGMLGLSGQVTSWETEGGKARIRGEIWKVRTHDGSQLNPGTQVRVTDVDGLTLTVREEQEGGT